MGPWDSGHILVTGVHAVPARHSFVRLASFTLDLSTQCYLSRQPSLTRETRYPRDRSDNGRTSKNMLQRMACKHFPNGSVGEAPCRQGARVGRSVSCGTLPRFRGLTWLA